MTASARFSYKVDSRTDTDNRMSRKDYSKALECGIIVFGRSRRGKAGHVDHRAKNKANDFYDMAHYGDES